MLLNIPVNTSIQGSLVNCPTSTTMCVSVYGREDVVALSPWIVVTLPHSEERFLRASCCSGKCQALNERYTFDARGTARVGVECN